MKIVTLISTILVWCSNLMLYAHPPFKVDCAQSSFNASSHFSYLLQKDSLSVDQAVTALAQGKFTIPKNDIVKMGNGHTFVWVHLSFENRCRMLANLAVRLKNTGIAQVILFQKQDGTFKRIVRWERGVYFGSVPNLPKNTAPTFLIPLNARARSEIIMLVKKNFAQPAFSVKVFSENSLIDTEMKEFIIDGLLFGFFFFVIIFNLFLFISLRDRVYLIYICFVASSTLFYATHSGYGLFYLWPQSPNFDSYACIIFSLTWIFSFIQFTQTFTGQTANDGSLYYINSFFKWLAILNLVPLFFSIASGKNILDTYTGPKDFILQGTLILAMFPVYLTGLKKALQGDRPSQLYLTANTVYGLALGFDALNRWDILEIPYLIAYTFSPVGMVIEVLLLSFGLTLRYHQFKHNHDKMQMALVRKEKEITLTMITTQDAERERIAQDLHDDLGGTIATVNTRLSSLIKAEPQNPFQSEIKILSEIVRQAGNQIRQIAHNLMPPEFEKSGLVESVKERVNSVASARYTVSVFGNEQRMLPERELNSYRIVMEVLNNIQKHAGATVVSVQFLFHPDLLTIVIEDNGSRFSLKNNAENHSGIGLKNINSRLLYLNGRMQSDKNPSGTTLIIDIPYENLPSERKTTQNRT